MNDVNDKFAAEVGTLQGPGVEFWKNRRDTNAAVRTDEDIWREQSDKAEAVCDTIETVFKASAK